MLPIQPQTIFLIAGEPSGDFLGASLIEGLKTLDRPLIFQGIGGPRMEAAGEFQSFLPMGDLSLMGLEILSHLPRVLRHLQATKRHLRATLPQVLLTIDAPEFSLRVARGVADTPIRKIHCVAPSVWAVRPGRARKIAGYLDHLLALLPFEPPYFEREGLATTFVGHPFADRPPGNPERFWQNYPELSPEKPLLVLAPGSRRGEMSTLLPAFLKTVTLLHKTVPELQCVLPTLPHLMPMLTQIIDAQGIKPLTVSNPDLHRAIFAAGTAALAASGTVTLEIALEQTPLVVAYRVSSMMAWVLRRMIITPYVSLPNILLNGPVAPECLQEQCHAERFAEVLLPLVRKEKAWDTQHEAFRSLRPLLKAPLPFALESARAVGGYLI